MHTAVPRSLDGTTILRRFRNNDTAKKRGTPPYHTRSGGEGGIRTHGTVSRTLAFEASTLNRSVTSPRRCSFHRSRAFNFPAMHRQGVCLCLARLAAFCEKLLHHRRTLLSEDAQSNFHLVVEARI